MDLKSEVQARLVFDNFKIFKLSKTFSDGCEHSHIKKIKYVYTYTHSHIIVFNIVIYCNITSVISLYSA